MPTGVNQRDKNLLKVVHLKRLNQHNGKSVFLLLQCVFNLQHKTKCALYLEVKSSVHVSVRQDSCLLVCNVSKVHVKNYLAAGSQILKGTQNIFFSSFFEDMTIGNQL